MTANNTHSPIFAAALGDRFVAGLRDCLTVEEFEVVRQLNATAEYAGCCASHDFLDANMVMLDAVTGLMPGGVDLITGGEDGFSEAACALWNAAWFHAMTALTA